MCAKTTKGNLASRSILYHVCGYESIQMSEPKLLKEYSLLSGNQSFPFMDRFTSTNVNCNVSQYKLVELDEDGKYVAYSADDIIIDTNGEISLKTDSAMQKTVYIEASTAFGVNSTYLEI